MVVFGAGGATVFAERGCAGRQGRGGVVVGVREGWWSGREPGLRDERARPLR
jgi:hypothetical protein